MITVQEAGKRAKAAARSIMLRTEKEKNEALLFIADALLKNA